MLTPAEKPPALWPAPPCSADKAAVFVLDEFDLFATRQRKQTLLYSLLDALQTSGVRVGGELLVASRKGHGKALPYIWKTCWAAFVA
jgi:hypothetical protein